MTFSYKNILPLFIGLASIASCSESDNEVAEYDNWKSRNDEYFQKLYKTASDKVAAGDTNWRIIKSYTKGDNTPSDATNSIIVEVVSQREQHNEWAEPAYAACPSYNDSVKIHYRGRLMPTDRYKEGYQFDSSWLGDFNVNTALPIKGCTNNFVTGFTTALMHMHVGDRWIVHIPYQLGYSDNAQSSIPAYSTMSFDVTLTAFSRPGNNLPVAN